ncbi:tRNA uridine-5-carboxymethylaminomethyl(34) synthesis GTPase MnmE, partial [Mesorhizobium sp. M1D.F.Ca.ET.234.01.1.1]
MLLLEDMAAPVPAGDIPGGVPLLSIGTKSDIARAGAGGGYDLVISTKDGTGLGRLLDEIGIRAAAAVDGAGDVLPSRLRHVELLNETRDLLMAALSGQGQELRAEELRLASDRLGR